MKYTAEKKEKYTTLSILEENLNTLIAPDLKSELIVKKNEGVKNMILNLTDVKFVDSSGLSAILTGHRLWKGTGTFILTGVEHPSVKRLIEISRLETILNIIPTMEESVDFVIMEELERELNAEPDSDE